MRHLLKSDLLKVFRNKFLYIAVVIVAAATVIDLIGNIGNEDFCFDHYAGSAYFYIGLLIGVVVPLVVCEDFHSGMIRNKIIAGYSRLVVFLSSLIASLISSMVLVGAWAICYFPLCAVLFGLDGCPECGGFLKFLMLLVCLLLMVTAITVLNHLFSMIIGRKAIVITIAILLPLILQTFIQPCVMVTCYSEPTTLAEVEELDNNDGTVVVTYKEVPNISYVEDGTPIKTFCYFIDTIDVPGQYIMAGTMRTDIVPRYIIADLAISLLVSSFGFLMFKKKDIK